MKLWILSDLHADHGEGLPEPPEGAEIAVVAGDVLSDRCKAWHERPSPYQMAQRSVGTVPA